MEIELNNTEQKNYKSKLKHLEMIFNINYLVQQSTWCISPPGTRYSVSCKKRCLYTIKAYHRSGFFTKIERR